MAETGLSLWQNCRSMEGLPAKPHVLRGASCSEEPGELPRHAWMWHRWPWRWEAAGPARSLLGAEAASLVITVHELGEHTGAVAPLHGWKSQICQQSPAHPGEAGLGTAVARGKAVLMSVVGGCRGMVMDLHPDGAPGEMLWLGSLPLLG